MVVRIFEDDLLRITSRHKTSRRETGSVLLSFTGIGHEMGGINVQKPEFFGVGRSFDNIVFITDKTRSWGNRLDFSAVREAITPAIGDRTVHSIGNSIGGFNSIVSTHYIPTHTCIAFVPQYSVNPSVVPWETRWKKYTSRIESFRIDRAGDHMNDTTRYFLFSGGDGPDRKHAEMFPVRENLHHYAFPGITHKVAQTLKKMDALDRVVQSCFDHTDGLPKDLEYDVLSPDAARPGAAPVRAAGGSRP
ncbi:hypothetical protein [Wenxinia marina]|uniref:Peptidase S9 prolyl oligopeptidase catalytic domain-containing protein n=1 Tax=Wenxinia marina DSM 24838 TaxID=1123501 RepID=A0A0D0QK52_9RHOB|nr:hypothetical protein [Wenxinia marina]KIQ71388.1 hypothetical protein Wenmar_04099 [Wenxinia marina DSM 24838]GGL79144.1 hypothetical protein GCM10011392_37030 [Wenxinia marina]